MNKRSQNLDETELLMSIEVWKKYQSAFQRAIVSNERNYLIQFTLVHAAVWARVIFVKCKIGSIMYAIIYNETYQAILPQIEKSWIMEQNEITRMGHDSIKHCIDVSYMYCSQSWTDRWVLGMDTLPVYIQWPYMVWGD